MQWSTVKINFLSSSAKYANDLQATYPDTGFFSLSHAKESEIPNCSFTHLLAVISHVSCILLSFFLSIILCLASLAMTVPPKQSLNQPPCICLSSTSDLSLNGSIKFTFIQKFFFLWLSHQSLIQIYIELFSPVSVCDWGCQVAFVILHIFMLLYKLF